MQQPAATEPRPSQTDRAVERYRALRKLNYQHSPAVFQVAREFNLQSDRIQRELTLRSSQHRQAMARKAAQPPEVRTYRPEVAPASSVPTGDR